MNGRVRTTLILAFLALGLIGFATVSKSLADNKHGLLFKPSDAKDTPNSANVQPANLPKPVTVEFSSLGSKEAKVSHLPAGVEPFKVEIQGTTVTQMYLKKAQGVSDKAESLSLSVSRSPVKVTLIADYNWQRTLPGPEGSEAVMYELRAVPGTTYVRWAIRRGDIWLNFTLTGMNVSQADLEKVLAEIRLPEE